MTLTNIILLAVLIIVGYYLLKFLWNVVGNLVKLVLAIVIIGAGIYLIKPELLHDVFGEETVENVANGVKETASDVVDNAKDVAKDSLNSK